MAKYIDVKVLLEKTIRIDNDNLQEALEIVKKQFPDLELTAEWLDSREVTFKENILINSSAEKLAELCHNDFNIEYLKDILDMLLDEDEAKDYIYNETINILKNKYYKSDLDIKI